MKKIIAFFLLLTAMQYAFAQKDSVQSPYLRFPVFPPVQLMLSDSTLFSKNDLGKNAAVILMLFSPECDHCQHTTEELIKQIDKFKKYEIVMATTLPFESMKAFRNKYALANHSNIIVGHDRKYFLPVFYNIHSLPFFAFYNRKKELITVFEGTLSINRMLEILTK